jgi:uncharacterized membrane protein HdeD (DUF308 family)
LSELSGIWNSVVIAVVSIFLGLLALRYSPIFNPIFVAIIVAILWIYTGRVDRLEKKLAQLEAKLSGSPSDPTQEHPNA